MSSPTPAGRSVLIRPAVFTAAFTGAAMVGLCCLAVREQESLILGGWNIVGRKIGEFGEEMRRWWAGLRDTDQIKT